MATTFHLTLRVALAASLLCVVPGAPLGAAQPGVPLNPVHDERLPIRGIVRPLHQASIATDLAARIARINFREAQSFHKGDVLVSFDCERLQAEHAAVEAVHREMKVMLESNVFLDKKGAVGKLDVEVSRARLDKARAEADALAARLKQCEIVAPFDGRVTELAVNEHEIPAAGKPLISIVEGNAFEIDLIVPSAWLRRLGPGAPFAFSIDETGSTYDAHLLRIGAAVDPVSQTVKVIAAFDTHDERILAGMSGSARFPIVEPGQ